MSDFRPSRMQAICLAIGVLVVQQSIFRLMPEGPGRTLFLDLLIIFANCLAIGGSIAAALRGRGVVRIFWLLFGSAFALQLVAGVSWVWIRYFHVAVADGALFPSLFYRLYVGPMAIALFLTDDVRTTRLGAFLDSCIVVGLVGLSMFQLQAAELNAHDPSLWRLISVGFTANGVLALGASARFYFAGQGNLRGRFAREAIYLWTHSAVALVTSIGDAYFSNVDSAIDLAWIVIYLAGAVLAFTWQPSAAGYELQKPRIGRRASLLSFNLTLAAMVLGSAILGLRAVNPSSIVALVAISIILFSYAIRGSLTQDNQERYLAELQESRVLLQHQALYDELTKLPNRRLFAERLAQALAVARREKHTIALVYLDLDGFKPVNDTLGHAVGDVLLNQAAQRMLSRVRKSDTLARMGGDEFTVLLVHLLSKEHAEMVASELLRALAEPFQIEGHAIKITASAGIGVFPDGATEFDALVHQADAAMYAVKRAGGNGVRYYFRELG